MRSASNLVDELHVQDHLTMAAHGLGLSVPLFPRAAINEVMEEHLTKFGEVGKTVRQVLTKRIGELSVGQKQMVAIAVSLMGNRSALTADESTANLDAVNVRSFFLTLKQLAATAQIPVVTITHDLLLASGHGSRFYVIRDGTVERVSSDGTPDERLKRLLVVCQSWLDG